MKKWLTKGKRGQRQVGFFIKSEPAKTGRIYWLGYYWPTGVQVDEIQISNTAYRALKGGFRS